MRCTNAIVAGRHRRVLRCSCQPGRRDDAVDGRGDDLGPGETAEIGGELDAAGPGSSPDAIVTMPAAPVRDEERVVVDSPRPSGSSGQVSKVALLKYRRTGHDEADRFAQRLRRERRGVERLRDPGQLPAPRS